MLEEAYDDVRDTDEWDEDGLLITCALRFNAYDYADKHRKELGAIVKKARQSKAPTDLELYCVFFHAQRFLYKWGGEMLSRRSAVWKEFRELFLRLRDVEIPPEYQDRYCQEQWDRIYRPSLDEHVRKLQALHKATDYANSDVVD